MRPHDFQPLIAGSNNWAVSGAFTSHGKPIVADDMHLGLMVPNIWFRASLVLTGTSGEQRITGVTLPGTPLVIAGSNGKIAWGFTNSQGDWLDLVVLEPGPEEGTYLTPGGPLPLAKIEERIIASDGTEDVLEIEETIWGPVVKTDHLGRKLAACWVAYDPEGMNMGLAALEGSSSVDEALEIAARCGMPAQNFTVADFEGNIGWTIAGPIPRRVGYSGEVPQSWASGECHWDGYLEPKEYPRIINPSGGRIWTANARVVSGEMLAKVGFGGYILGARAKQIRDDLFAMDNASEKDLLGVQLDHRAVFLSRWRDLLLDEVLLPEVLEGRPRLREARDLLENWGGKASADSAGYRIVRACRNQVAKEIFEALTAGCKEADDQFGYYFIRANEGPLWKLVKEQPTHLLPPGFESWDGLMLDSLEQLIGEAEKDPTAQGTAGLAGWTWGVRNTASIRHPLSPFIPSFFSRYLDAPPDQLPGDSDMPRAQGPDFGASERMVVSPGLEEQGIFHMPGGQSGHPLSPFYLSGHADWVQGNPSPFLPGEALYTLLLKP
jgi:penicillin amidase